MKLLFKLRVVFRSDGRIHHSSVIAKPIAVTVWVMVHRHGPLMAGEDIVGTPVQLNGVADGLKEMLLDVLLTWTR